MLQNVSEDTDDMLDDLFDRYGKVVYSRKDKMPPSAELDDDAESLSCKLKSESIWRKFLAVWYMFLFPLNLA